MGLAEYVGIGQNRVFGGPYHTQRVMPIRLKSFLEDGAVRADKGLYDNCPEFCIISSACKGDGGLRGHFVRNAYKNTLFQHMIRQVCF